MNNTIQDRKYEWATGVHRDAKSIINTDAEKYLKIAHGINLDDLPKGHGLRYHPNCPYYKSGGGSYPAIIALMKNKSGVNIGILIFNLKNKTIFTIGKNVKSGVVIIGDFDAEEMIFAKDFITALKLTSENKKPTCAYINNENLYAYHPPIGKIKKIILYAENATEYAQLRIGSKQNDFWGGIGVQLVFKRLDEAAINFKNNQFWQKKPLINTK